MSIEPVNPSGGSEDTCHRSLFPAARLTLSLGMTLDTDLILSQLVKAMSLSIHDYLSDAGLGKWIAELGCVDAPIPRLGIRTALSFFPKKCLVYLLAMLCLLSPRWICRSQSPT